MFHCLSEPFPSHRLNPSPSLALLFSLNFLSCCTAPFSYASHPPFLLFLLQNPHLQSTPTSLLLLKRPHFFPLIGKHSYLGEHVLKENLDFNYCPTFALVMKVFSYKNVCMGPKLSQKCVMPLPLFFSSFSHSLTIFTTLWSPTLSIYHPANQSWHTCWPRGAEVSLKKTSTNQSEGTGGLMACQSLTCLRSCDHLCSCYRV